MKKQVSVLFICLLAFSTITKKALCQNGIDTIVDLDILTIPNSPAFNLLGISPSDVDKPTTPADFAFSVANAAGNLSQLPTNYAIEFLPLSFFPQRKSDYQKFTNKLDKDEKMKCWKKLRNNIAQTFIISSGFNSIDSIDTSVPNYIKTQNGTGFKFSLLRGKIDDSFVEYKDSIMEIRKTLKLVHDNNDTFMDSIRQSDPFLSALKKRKEDIQARIVAGESNLLSEGQLVATQLAEREEVLKNEVYKNETDNAKRLRKQIENIKFKRYGWQLDFAGGIVLGFRNNDFQNSIVQKYAFWINGGYSLKKNFSILGLVRNTKAFDAGIDENGKSKDENIWDLGGKIEFQTKDSKFSLTGELIWRSYSDTSVSRYSVNASYQVGKNQALTFSIGKAFAGKTQAGGNLIAALNYVRMFGSKRAITPKGL